MRRRSSLTFTLLIAAQAAHSVEEYAGRLYDVFPPARFASGLVAADRRLGFLALNVAIVACGAVCVAAVWRGRWSGVMWFWIAIETINGIGHPAWSILRGGYTPGVATAPVLLVLAITLAVQRSTRASSRP